MRIIQSTIFLIFLSISLLSYGEIFYVDAVKGSNDNMGSSSEDSWQTISHALSQANGSTSKPATIIIAAGTYNVELGEVFPLELQSNTTLKGLANRDKIIIDAKNSGTSTIACIRKKISG